MGDSMTWLFLTFRFISLTNPLIQFNYKYNKLSVLSYFGNMKYCCHYIKRRSFQLSNSWGRRLKLKRYSTILYIAKVLCSVESTCRTFAILSLNAYKAINLKTFCDVIQTLIQIIVNLTIKSRESEVSY